MEQRERRSVTRSPWPASARERDQQEGVGGGARHPTRTSQRWCHCSLHARPCPGYNRNQIKKKKVRETIKQQIEVS